MRTGHFSITNTGIAPEINVRLVNGTVWLTKPQIADLFFVNVQKIEGCLKAGFRSGALIESAVCHTHRYTDAQGEERQTIFYNLEALIFISYHANSANIVIFRQWVAQAIREHLQKQEVQKIMQFSMIVHRGNNYPMS